MTKSATNANHFSETRQKAGISLEKLSDISMGLSKSHEVERFLAKDQHADMVIELLALYLPQSSISQLSSTVVSSRNGGAV